MTKSLSRLQGSVVVVTGASSGIGRASCIAFAQEGCRVVLAARRREALEATAELCASAGGETLVVPTDVKNESEVQFLIKETLSQWGRIDILVNNAGTTLFSLVEQGDFALHREVLETILIGAIHVARAVLPVLRRQKTGTLINVGSVLSKVGQPFVPSYVVSKFGLRGLSEAIRSELADELKIHICTIFPYAVVTPHFESGGNVTGREAHAMPSAQQPEIVAKSIVGLAKRPRRELHVPRYIVLGIALHWLFPRTTERLLLHALQTFHLGKPQEPTTGNLFGPTEKSGAVYGVRRPLTSNLAFAIWAIKDLTRMIASSFRRTSLP